MTVRRVLRCVIVVTVLGAMSVAVLAQTAASIARGKDLAERACAGCHAITGNEPRTIQGRLVPSLTSIAGGPNATTERLKAIISTPRHPMPATNLALSEINDLTAYIRSLQ
jgi:mono/diheme cytochrome c family protein